MLRIQRLLLLLALTLMLSACPNAKSDQKLLDKTLESFSSQLRWGEDFNQTLGFLDPAERDKLQPKPLEIERWNQYRVIGVHSQPALIDGQGLGRQRMSVELVSRHTQITRTIQFDTLWRFDSETDRWYLISPFPLLRND
ncbi:hypothetical protein C7S18_01625 [Ahniella affigens]|uniref:Uncharacterized protein n=1 Tax=Ahniella affigens TaxID=2021234 RepID=A0A2P1PM98_9GAMM|nr:hypothetical protein [Ahniella affigens]AVP95971.1 hypothetical protein C7S18_01625 [Ahniella affigens]